MKMKKLLALVLAVLMILPALVACNSNSGSGNVTTETPGATELPDNTTTEAPGTTSAPDGGETTPPETTVPETTVPETTAPLIIPENNSTGK